jgi:pimeloyl-ACP methyl ester carboxylesterase
MSFSEETVPVREGRFRVRLRRAGAGPPLVYLHGSGGQAQIDPFLEDLARDYSVLVPTHPGWPGSDGLEHIDNAVDMALFYLDFFDALGLRSLHLMGSSLGAMFAAEVAALGGPYVRRLVLCAPPGLWLDDIEHLDFFAASPEQLERAVFFDPEQAARRREAGQPASPEEASRAMLDRETALAAAGKFLWPIWDKGLKKRIHRIKAPALLIWGEKDGLVPPAYGPEFQRLIPDSRLVIMERAAHVPMVEQPDAFLRLVRGFLREA